MRKTNKQVTPKTQSIKKKPNYKDKIAIFLSEEDKKVPFTPTYTSTPLKYQEISSTAQQCFSEHILE